MKITFNFDRDCRAFNMEPEDELEFAVLREIAEQVKKGQTLSLTKLEHPDANLIFSGFRVEMKVNGHQARVTRPEANRTGDM